MYDDDDDSGETAVIVCRERERGGGSCYIGIDRGKINLDIVTLREFANLVLLNAIASHI